MNFETFLYVLWGCMFVTVGAVAKLMWPGASKKERFQAEAIKSATAKIQRLEDLNAQIAAENGALKRELTLRKGDLAQLWAFADEVLRIDGVFLRHCAKQHSLLDENGKLKPHRL